MRALILRLDAPWMSFGAPIVDHHGFIERFPGQAMLTGLIANALGWDHGDADRLQALQKRLVFAARWDVPPQEVVDYQTVDLGQPKLRETGWTTRGAPEHRKGGQQAKYGTHIRLRHYWEDGLMTLALAIEDGEEPNLNEIRAALRRPARPLFLGRKSCLPARPLLDPQDPMVEADSILEALKKIPVWSRNGTCGNTTRLEACWPSTPEVCNGAMETVYDLRDWHAQLMTGEHRRMRGVLPMGKCE
ncbi:MAG: type I-E CRISPR-associated protein Cas5/CasD [Gammaproteobacteria bacterium]|nr:MAG: type I-E CRISPR-associated protein Cas5/CasD [Gammaproteobacteria bacterium]